MRYAPQAPRHRAALRLRTAQNLTARKTPAGVAELADAQVSKTCDGNIMRVRAPPPAHTLPLYYPDCPPIHPHTARKAYLARLRGYKLYCIAAFAQDSFQIDLRRD